MNTTALKINLDSLRFNDIYRVIIDTMHVVKHEINFLFQALRHSLVHTITLLYGLDGRGSNSGRGKGIS